ncbi:MAG TPA: SRPBCC family protein [Acidimicrobiia bacterium]|nr:SRPBCC family protein [Acidimicrobiia bacterium]
MSERPKLEVHGSAVSSAPPEAVWALLADARGWTAWTRFTHASLEREGDPPPDGVGAIRCFGTKRQQSREEVVHFEPPRQLSYRLLKGLPIDDYRADVVLTPDGTGTRVDWTGRFHARRPGTGWFWRAFLTLALRDFSKRLARAATNVQ